MVSGYKNKMDSSNESSIITGRYNYISTSDKSTIVSGDNNKIFSSKQSSILSGCLNLIGTSSYFSTITGGYCNIIHGCYGRYSLIAGGQKQELYCANTSLALTSYNSKVKFSYRSAVISSKDSIVEGKSTNKITNSVIVGGDGNKIYCSDDSIILGGKNLILSGKCSIVYVPELRIATASLCNSLDMILVRDSDGYVRYRDVSSISGCGGGSVAINTNEVAFGTGSGITSSSLFKWNSSTCNFTATYDTTNLTSTTASVILGGGSHKAKCAQNSAIISGSNNYIYGQSSYIAKSSSIISGKNNSISRSNYSIIAGGSDNSIQYSTYNSSIVAGQSNTIGGGSCDTFIGGGVCNFPYQAKKSAMIGGSCNCLDNSSNSSIIGGFKNCMFASVYSVIIGGVGLSMSSRSCSVLVPNFLIAGSMSPNSGANFGINSTFSSDGFTFCICNGVIISKA